jgi:hypothetical protein
MEKMFTKSTILNKFLRQPIIPHVSCSKIRFFGGVTNLWVLMFLSSRSEREPQKKEMVICLGEPINNRVIVYSVTCVCEQVQTNAYLRLKR